MKRYGQPGPVLLGADANTPLTDAVDFADTRTHRHSPSRPTVQAA